MAALKMLNLMAIATLALFASTLNTPANALSVGHEHLNRQIPHVHQAVAHKRKRGANGRCITRSATPVAASSTPAPPPPSSSAAPPPAKSPAPAPAPPAPAPAPAPAAAAVSLPSWGGSPKIGISWNSENNPASLANVVTSHTGALYTWSAWKPQDNIFGLKFVPMLWGPKQQGDWDKLVIAGYANAALALNEPDEPSQLNMSPQDAAGYWKSEVEPKKYLGYDLWSPAVTSSARGEAWFDSWLEACAGGCSFSHVALHMYDTDPQALIDYVQHWHDKYGKNVVITEFACQSFGGKPQASMDEVWAFYKKVIPWLVSQPWVDVIFPFGFLEDMGNVNPANQLLKGGQLTPLGQYIVGGNW